MSLPLSTLESAMLNRPRIAPQPKRCDAEARRGTGTGVCDRPLDEHGNCDRASAHTD